TDHLSQVLLSRPANGPFGVHDLKAGLEYEHQYELQAFGPPGGQILYINQGSPVQATYVQGFFGATTTHRVGAFLQDAWAPAARLTLSAGVRWDRNRGDAPGHEAAFLTAPVSP